jgi:hypothetical protein
MEAEYNRLLRLLRLFQGRRWRWPAGGQLAHDEVEPPPEVP